MFVVRRAYRVNDSLPGEAASQPRWLWQRGRWLLVDRNTSRISQIKLPDFDPIILMSLYRDYAVYCGVADDGERVAASFRRSPLANRSAGSSWRSWVANSPNRYTSREWQRQPARVTFSPQNGAKITGRSSADSPT